MSKSKEIGQEFITNQKFRNDLDIIPIGPKLLEVLSLDRHYKFSNTSLHQTCAFPIITGNKDNGMGCKVLQ
jgi:hypothetical protein